MNTLFFVKLFLLSSSFDISENKNQFHTLLSISGSNDT